VKLLIDTHVLIWWLGDDKALPKKIKRRIIDEASEVFVSSVSAFEITTKFRIGKLPSAALLVQDLSGYIERAGFAHLDLTAAHATRAGLLTHPHRDPFDRLLAAQALVENMPFASVDEIFDELQVQRVGR
jgi:PIN domain nuclease of toxin-antitoxin system